MSGRKLLDPTTYYVKLAQNTAFNILPDTLPFDRPID